MGPAQLNPEISVDVAPHPHIGLQTVTWVFSGQFLHKDSLGSEQLIEPGQLNLMGAGFGVVHAEEDPNHHRGTLHGMQLWIAQPDSTRQGQSSFQHLSEVPQFELGNISGRVLIGDMAGASSSAQVDSPTLGAELTIRPGVTSLSLSRQFEYAVVVAQGSVLINGQVVAPGSLAYLGTDRDELVIEARETSTAMLIGGEPITEKLMMWWNFVARTQEEISQAYRDWTENSERFGPVNSKFPRIQMTPPIWFK
jgi:quercetin 2,3-dioxygenase